MKESKPQGGEDDAQHPKKIVFDNDDNSKDKDGEEGDGKDQSPMSAEANQLAELLQFFITPSYLRNLMFAHDQLKGLQYAKKLPKLPRLPFLSHNKSNRYLEGLTVSGRVEKFKRGSRKSKKQLHLESTTDLVNVGGQELVKLKEQRVPLDARVTVDVQEQKVVSAKVAYASDTNGPWNNHSSTFGYTVRTAPSFGRVFVESIYEGGYTFTAYAPSEYFTNEQQKPKIAAVDANGLMNKDKVHLLVVVGRWEEIEQAVKDDKQDLDVVDDASTLFDGQLNINGNNRVEDCVLMTLSKLEGI